MKAGYDNYAVGRPASQEPLVGIMKVETEAGAPTPAGLASGCCRPDEEAPVAPAARPGGTAGTALPAQTPHAMA